MTTVLTHIQSGASTDGTLRMLSIAANLLPVEIVESRRGRKVRRAVVAAMLSVVAVLAAWYGMAHYQTSAARATLTSTEDDARRLAQQQRAFSDVVSVQAESKAISTQISTLLAGDLRWSRLLSAVQQVAPPGVQTTAVVGALTPADTGGDSAGDQLPSTTTDKSIGALTVTGTAPNKALVAAYVDALGKVPGLANPLVVGVSVASGAVQFTVRLDVTSAALGGRYTTNGTGGGS